jgi:hypothetical protein
MFSLLDRQRPQAERQVAFHITVIFHTLAAITVAGAFCLRAYAINDRFRHKYKIKMKIKRVSV